MKRHIFLFALLSGYLVLSFSWWTYLHLASQDEIYRLRTGLARLERGADSAVLQQEAEDAFRGKYVRKVWMITGEAAVFMALLAAGLLLIYRSFRDEIQFSKVQKNFMLAITHELKSPLASIKLALQTLQRDKLKTSVKEQVIKGSISDIERLSELVDNALMAARLERGEHLFEKREVSLSDLYAQVAGQSPAATTHNVITRIQPGIRISGDTNALSSVLANLLDNAAKYSAAGSEIFVDLLREGEHVMLKVTDNGTGIPDEEKSKIFGRFYRVGNEETRTFPGAGLGLFIVREVVHQHGGKIAVRDNNPSGTIFETVF